MRVFTNRHRKAIFEKKIRVSLPTRLRKRIWQTIEKVLREASSNSFYGPEIQCEVELELNRAYGTDNLRIKKYDEGYEDVELKKFVEETYPAQVLDVIELFYDELADESKAVFQTEINSLFEQEEIPWRLTEGEFFQIDSEFLEQKVIGKTIDLLKAEGFDGALGEFVEAKKDFESGDYKGTVQNSCNSFESVMTTILGQDNLSASSLIRNLQEQGFYHDINDNFSRAIGEQVLMSLPFLRNRLSGHGQGSEIITVPKEYAELALNLSATFIQFLIKKSFAYKPEETASPEITDEIPF